MTEQAIAVGGLQHPPTEEVEPVRACANPTQNMARRLHDAYQRECAWRRLRVEKVRSAVYSSKELQPFWLKLARDLILQECDNPERFMHVQFCYGVPTGTTLATCPFTNSLQTTEAYKRYRRQSTRMDAHLAQDLQSNCRSFDYGMMDTRASYPHKSEREAWDFVLLNKLYDMSPLFRYCIAHSEHLASTTRLHYDEALQQLLSDPQGYAKVWKDVIPRQLLDTVANILQTKL